MSTSEVKTISFIGAGNVAWHLAKGLFDSGYTIGSIWSRDPRHALELASRTGSRVSESVNDLHPGTDLVILSVKDEVLPQIANELKSYNGLIVHTSGSLGLEIFGSQFEHAGVFYPLQTFSRQVKLELSKIPFFIETRQYSDLEVIMDVARALSASVNISTETSRRIIHLAAVFACNFPNYLYAVARELLLTNGLDFDILRPLMEETTRKALYNNPEDVQTGPAVRNDTMIIEKHLDLLKTYPAYYELYKTVSEQIIEKYKTKQNQ